MKKLPSKKKEFFFITSSMKLSSRFNGD